MASFLGQFEPAYVGVYGRKGVRNHGMYAAEVIPLLADTISNTPQII